MCNIEDFCKNYDDVLSACLELLQERQSIMSDGMVVEQIDALKPFTDEETVSVSALVKVDPKELDGRVNCSSTWVSFEIPFYAFTDKERWFEEVRKQKEVLTIPVEGEDIPEWLSSLPENI